MWLPVFALISVSLASEAVTASSTLASEETTDPSPVTAASQVSTDPPPTSPEPKTAEPLPMLRSGSIPMILSCADTVTVSCEESSCRVTCSDGAEKTLLCPSQLVNTSQKGGSVHFNCVERDEL